MIGGWQFSGTSFFATGAPITPVAADTNLNLGESQKPNRIGKGIPDEIPGQRRGVDYPWFVLDDFVHTPSCVSVAKSAVRRTSTDSSRSCTATRAATFWMDPGLAYINSSMMKNFRFQERKNVQLRIESFNALNHPNFLLPNNQFNGSTAGLITQCVRHGGRGGSACVPGEPEVRVLIRGVRIRVLQFGTSVCPGLEALTNGAEARVVSNDVKRGMVQGVEGFRAELQ